jgi:hypothetical protein
LQSPSKAATLLLFLKIELWHSSNFAIPDFGIEQKMQCKVRPTPELWNCCATTFFKNAYLLSSGIAVPELFFKNRQSQKLWLCSNLELCPT